MRRAVLLLPFAALGACIDLPFVDSGCGEFPYGGCLEEDCYAGRVPPDDPRYSNCGGPIYRCEDGQWVTFAYCEPFPLKVGGPIRLTRTVEAGACAAPTTDLEIAVDGDRFNTVLTPAPPAELVSDNLQMQIGSAHLLATIREPWIDATDAGVIATVAYDLNFRYTGEIEGTAAAQADGTAPCSVAATVTGTFEAIFAP